MPRPHLGLFALPLLVACSSVSPRPDSLRAADLPRRELSPAAATELAASVERAMHAVVRRGFDDAAAAAEQALAIDPRCARAHAILGMVQLQRAGDSDPPSLRLMNGGEARVAMAVELAPDDPFVGWMQAVFLAEIGHLSAAAAAAERALQRAGNAAANERAALFGVAGTYRYELGEDRAAVPHLVSYVALRPDDATAQFRLGSSLLRIAASPQVHPGGLQKAKLDAESAARAFARTQVLAPGDEDAALAEGAAHWRVAELLTEIGQPEPAAAARAAAELQFRTVAQRFPRSAEACFRMAVICEHRGAPDEARTHYSAALELDGQHFGSLLNLAALSAAAGDRAAAATLLRRVLAVDDAEPRLRSGERRRIEAFLQS